MLIRKAPLFDMLVVLAGKPVKVHVPGLNFNHVGSTALLAKFDDKYIYCVSGSV